MRAAALALVLLAGASQAQTYLIDGDTQTLASRETIWQAKMAEIVAMQPDFVLGTGDVVQVPNFEPYFHIADRAYQVLRNAGIRYSLPSGNHDCCDLLSTNACWTSPPPPAPYWRLYDWLLERHPPATTLRSPDGGRAWRETIPPGIHLGVLPWAATQAEIDWLISKLSAGGVPVILFQHDALNPTTWAVSPAVSQVMAVVGPRLIGVIGGHYIPADRVRFDLLPGGIGWGLFSNYQGMLPQDEGWVTRLQYDGVTGEFCLKTLNVLTAAEDAYEAPHCL